METLCLKDYGSHVKENAGLQAYFLPQGPGQYLAGLRAYRPGQVCII